jgi:hypothetical protein
MGTRALLVIGSTAAHKVGPLGTLVPAPRLLLPLDVDGLGDARYELLLPISAPAGLELFFQALVPQGGPAPSQILTNALSATVPG